MADTTNELHTNEVNTDAAHGTEPATGHDIGEGGALGAVGGAIVGGLAGGPIGALIGAVAGGLASAGAVSVVDKHDHDYDRTAGTGGAHDSVTGLPTDGNVQTGAIGAAAPAAYGGAAAQTASLSGETVIPIVEEQIAVGKREVETGGARVHTAVIETPVEQTVSLHEEHVTVDRQRVSQPVSDVNAAFREQSFEVTETAELPVIAKQARVVEEVVVGKTATDHTETVHDTVRRTEVEVDELPAGEVRGR